MKIREEFNKIKQIQLNSMFKICFVIKSDACEAAQMN